MKIYTALNSSTMDSPWAEQAHAALAALFPVRKARFHYEQHSGMRPSRIFTNAQGITYKDGDGFPVILQSPQLSLAAAVPVSDIDGYNGEYHGQFGFNNLPEKMREQGLQLHGSPQRCREAILAYYRQREIYLESCNPGTTTVLYNGQAGPNSATEIVDVAMCFDAIGPSLYIYKPGNDAPVLGPFHPDLAANGREVIPFLCMFYVNPWDQMITETECGKMFSRAKSCARVILWDAVLDEARSKPYTDGRIGQMIKRQCALAGITLV